MRNLFINNQKIFKKYLKMSLENISPENLAEAQKCAVTFSKNLEMLLIKARELIISINVHPDVKNGRVVGSNLNLSLLEVAISAAASADKLNMMGGFIRRSEEHWDKIADRNLDFLINNANVLFHGAPHSEISEFSRAFQITDKDGNRILTEAQIAVLWEMFKALVIVCIRHIYHGRDPNAATKSYGNPEYFIMVDIKRHQVKFPIKK